MGKEKAIVLLVLAMFATGGVAQAIPSAFGYDLQADMHRSENKRMEEQQSQEYADGSEQQEEPPLVLKTAKDFYSFVPMKDLYVSTIDSNIYYENPTIRSAIARYKQGNYTGSLQELYAYIKKHPNDPYAYYCMGLAYTRLGQVTVAKNCYQKVINCNAQGRLFELALKGRDCLTGGTYCKEPVNPRPAVNTNDLLKDMDPLDQFIAAPYSGHGFTPELEKEYQQQQLDTIQKAINRKDSLNNSELESIKKK